MDSLVAAVVPFGFSGQVLAAVDGEVVLHRAYGMADRAQRRPMTVQTAIGVASITKQLTAAAVLKLAQEGRLSLADSIGAWLDGLPEDKRAITVDQLLIHTAGLQLGLVEDFEADTREEQVAAILDAPLTGPPGGEWRYSNAGYVLAAAIAEAAAGMPYESWLREALFRPAGMTHTGFLHDPPPGARLARAYVGWEDQGGIGDWPSNLRTFGSGDVVSTAADLWRWDRALREGRILEPEWRERYFAPQVDAGGGAGYAYGLFVHPGEKGPSGAEGPSEGEGTVIEHGGDTRLGFNGGFFRYADEGAVLIVLSNASLAPGRWMRHVVSADLERILRGEAPRYAPPAARLPIREEAWALAGAWRAGDEAFHVIDDGTHLWVGAEGQGASERVPGGPVDGHDLALASEKVRALLEGLLGGPPDGAYGSALTESGLPHLGSYVGEWERLTGALGPFERYAVAGSVPDGEGVRSAAHLRFRDGWVTIRYFWGEGGRGRLRGTNVSLGRRAPVLAPAAIATDGSLVVHDPWGETTQRLDVGARSLRFPDGARAVRAGPVGWHP